MAHYGHTYTKFLIFVGKGHLKMELVVGKIPDNVLVDEYINTQNIIYFDEIYKRYSNKIYYKCYSLLNDLNMAEDATQDIFMKLLINLSRFNQRSQFSTWLYSITYNHCIDQVRRLKKEKMLFSEEKEGSIDIMDEEEDYLMVESSLVALQTTLEVIDEADRTILLMKYQDNLMVKEIAEILRLSESAVKMRLKRAKEKFQKIYREVLRE